MYEHFDCDAAAVTSSGGEGKSIKGMQSMKKECNKENTARSRVKDSR